MLCLHFLILSVRFKSWDHFAIPSLSKIHVKTKVFSNDELFNQGLKEATMMVENSLLKLTDDGV